MRCFLVPTLALTASLAAAEPALAPEPFRDGTKDIKV